MLAIFGMLFYDSARPSEPTTRCRTNGVFGQNVRQRLGELVIKRRNCAPLLMTFLKRAKQQRAELSLNDKEYH